MISVKFKRVHPEARLPRQMTSGSLGLDLFAHILTESNREASALIPPRTVRAVSTGLLIEPPGCSTDFGGKDRAGNQWLLQVVSRSGLVKERSIWVANAPGIIDPDYRGPLMVLLYNGGHESQYIKHGDRIAQLILVRAEYIVPEITDELTETERGAKGLGSTGL